MVEPDFSKIKFIGNTVIEGSKRRFVVFENPDEGQFWLYSTEKICEDPDGNFYNEEVDQWERKGPLTARELLYKSIGYEND